MHSDPPQPGRDFAGTSPARPHFFKRGYQNFRIWTNRHPETYALIGLVLLCVVMGLSSDRFLSWENLQNIGRQVSINAIIAFGLTLVILTGGIDLSVGSVLSLSMTLCAGAMLDGWPISGAILLGLAVGAAVGAINGLLIAYAGLPAIIVTLATMEIPRGVALLYTGGYPKSGLPEAFAFLGQGRFLGLQTPTAIMFAAFALTHLLLSRLAIGRYIFAIGGNEQAARFSGVPVRRYKLVVYILSGLAAAVSGVILASRLMSGQPNAGVGFELDAIAAVVLGGTSITGGRGSALGTLIGAFMLGGINNGLNLAGISPYTQKIAKGLIILIAIYAGSFRQRDQS